MKQSILKRMSFQEFQNACEQTNFNREKSRETLKLLFVDRKNMSETAAQQGITVSAVSALRLRFLQRLEALETPLERFRRSTLPNRQKFIKDIQELSEDGYTSDQIQQYLTTCGLTHREIQTLLSGERNPSMKTLTLTNQKGGVGKTAIASQFSFFLANALNKRVLAIDLDHQGNFSKVLKNSDLPTVSKISSNLLLETPIRQIENEPFVLVPASGKLCELAADATKRNAFATNLKAFIVSQQKNFDVAIIDTNPNPDTRMLAALAVSDYALSPVQLNQEAIDGIVSIYNIVSQIQKVNKNLRMLGLLPNLLEPTKFQKENLENIQQQIKDKLIPVGESCAALKNRTAIAEAQKECKPVWTLGRHSSREAWAEMKPVFTAIAQLMEIHHGS